MNSDPRPLRIIIVGDVDHGKSTLIGRLLHDTGSLSSGKIEELKGMAARRGLEDIEWAFLTDAFQAERDQNITIDAAYVKFSTEKRPYVIIDAPGHREFLKSMVSGAATAEAAILVIDAMEGMREQTRRHAYLLHLLGMKQVVVVVNKMDLVGYDSETFHQIRRQAENYLSSLGIVPAHIIPVSARQGDMIAHRENRLDWYTGPVLTEALDGFEPQPLAKALPLRFPVQDVYRFGHERVLVGRVESGFLKKGDEICFSPSGEKAIVAELRVWPEDESKTEARAGECLGITLDRRIFVERGHMGSHTINSPALSDTLRARIFWLGDLPLKVGNTYKIRYTTCEAQVTVQAISSVIDTEDLKQDENATEVTKGAVSDIVLRARNPLPVDTGADGLSTGKIVLYNGHDLVGGGVISQQDGNGENRLVTPEMRHIHAVSSLVRYEDRIRSAGHRGEVFWLTGLSGAGKTTLAMLAEKELFMRGLCSFVLDGDNIRRGLCADLGFAAEDRAENIRRVGEVAALMAEAGLIVLTSFISPFQADRERARQAAGDRFHEIFVKADLAICETRDPKGLYRKARAGEIRDFTGIDSPYEAPRNPDLVIDTAAHDINACLAQLLAYIEAHVALNQRKEENARAF